MIPRHHAFKEIKLHFRSHPIVALLGPRQCGKTTLAKEYAATLSKKHHYFDLEDPADLALLDSAKSTLENLEGLIVIDEVQRRPELFPVLRVLADQKRGKKKFLILGSASPELLKQSSESLAGRISYLELGPFSVEEVGQIKPLWLRGGFPLSFLARSLPDSIRWRQSFISTFLERDIPMLGFQIPHASLRRFWMMLAHYHGQIMNYSELGHSLGTNHHTVQRYLDILDGTFMVRLLPPWFENLKKRQVKAPKVYFRDSGIFHTLMGIQDQKALQHHPKLGASWEGFALENILRLLRVERGEAYFWATHNQAELDLLVFKNGRRYGFEFKHADSPHVTRSMQIALEDLKLDRLFVIYLGNKHFTLQKRVVAVGFEEILELPTLLKAKSGV